MGEHNWGMPGPGHPCVVARRGAKEGPTGPTVVEWVHIPFGVATCRESQRQGERVAGAVELTSVPSVSPKWPSGQEETGGPLMPLPTGTSVLGCFRWSHPGAKYQASKAELCAACGGLWKPWGVALSSLCFLQ